MVLNTGTLHELRQEFTKELEGGGKSSSVEAEESGRRAEKGRGRKYRAAMPWTVETAGKDLRKAFSTT